MLVCFPIVFDKEVPFIRNLLPKSSGLCGDVLPGPIFYVCSGIDPVSGRRAIDGSAKKIQKIRGVGFRGCQRLKARSHAGETRCSKHGVIVAGALRYRREYGSAVTVRPGEPKFAAKFECVVS